MRRTKIYAVDFDGTLCYPCFPDIGAPNKRLIKWCIKKQKQGNTIIMWTCRVGDKLKEAVNWCASQGLWFDYVNENPPEQTEYFGTDPRKVFAHVYIDDRARGFRAPPQWVIISVYKKFFKKCVDKICKLVYNDNIKTHTH